MELRPNEDSEISLVLKECLKGCLKRNQTCLSGSSFDSPEMVHIISAESVLNQSDDSRKLLLKWNVIFGEMIDMKCAMKTNNQKRL